MLHTLIEALKHANKKLLTFTIILVVGSLIYSGTLFILNLSIPVEKMTSLTNREILALENRIIIRRGIEIFYSVCEIVYFVGTIIVLWKSVTVKTTLKIKELLIFPAGTIIALFLCNIPFALMDEYFAVDYFIPVFEVLGNILLVFTIACVVTFMKDRRV
ncbi:hypothetical protein M2140_000198 [Clostridiales Family XIII bacterium PM5-7]